MHSNRSIHLTFLCAFLSLVLLDPPVSAQPLKQVPWQELDRHLQMEGIALLDLPVVECPADLDPDRPARLVLQYIENVFYKWREYSTSNDPRTGSFCVMMMEPESRILKAEESRILLTASAQWQKPGLPSAEAYALDARDPRFQQPTVPPPSLTPLKSHPPNAKGYRPADSVGISLDPAFPPLGNPPAGSALRAQPEVVIGDDERTMVSNTQVYPFHTISYVSTSVPGQGNFRATCFLVAPYAAFTNGHVVYDRDSGKWSSNVEFSPGQYVSGGSVVRPYGTRSSSSIATFEGYISSGEVKWDAAVIKFSNPVTAISTYMPVIFDAPVSVGEGVNIAGYPSAALGANTNAMWLGYDNLTDVRSDYLQHIVDTSGGQSGSPMWVLENNSRRVIGIHSSGYTSNGVGTYNRGPRLAAHNQTTLEEWMRWTPSGAGTNPLLLMNGRFRIDATWRTADGKTGIGHPEALTSESGYFWFFSSSAIEVVVKVLDGRSINGFFWCFYGALSDVEYRLVLTDTVTGRTKTYNNPLYNLASVADVQAISGN